ncbi:MAG: VanW family protein, partial [Lachnospiraceae bacterium]|nr:VanW family protein [Lachnospiraceae bacterium]
MRFKNGLIFMFFILLCSFVSLMSFSAHAEEEVIQVNVAEKKEETEDPLNLKKGTIASNFFLGTRSLSGMTREEAQNEVISALNHLSDTNFVLKSAYRSDFRYGAFASDLGISYNLEAALQSIEAAVQTGSLLERYERAKDYQLEHGKVDTQLSMDEGKIMDYFNYVLPYWNCTPENAYVSYVDGNIAVTRGKIGLQFDFSQGFEKLFEDVRSLYYETTEDGEYLIAIDETPTDPELTYAKACELTVIGSFTTSFSAPTTETLANRMQNLIVSAQHVNGSTYAPGEQVSALNMYAVSEENGYKVAGTINDKTHTLELGGGICQTTTTLYNAVLFAELDVVLRRNHSMMVTYVDPSRDAMVYAQGGFDFKFRNSSSGYICIGAWVDTYNYTITVTIFGHEDHAPDHSVRYETEILELTVPPISFVEDRTKQLGWDNVTTKVTLHGDDGPTCGVRSQLWKVTTDNGVEQRTLVTGPDTYNPNGAVYDIAPDALCTATSNGPRESGYIAFVYTFSDGVTPLGANYHEWSAEQTNQFNRTMYYLMQQKGLVWPDGPGVPDPQPEPEP